MKGCTTAGIGCLECKQPLIERSVSSSRRCAAGRSYVDDPALVEEHHRRRLREARRLAAETMRDVREAMGLSYSVMAGSTASRSSSCRTTSISRPTRSRSCSRRSRPLDLLLYLIRKENLDILDIPMAPLTRQYLEYVEMMRKTNLELAAEYLVMAAMLMEIKSRLLLPRPPAARRSRRTRAPSWCGACSSTSA